MWDEWDCKESEATSRIGQFSDYTHTYLAVEGYCLNLVLFSLET